MYAKFDLSIEDSSDGESIFITQTPKVDTSNVPANDENNLNLELEDLMQMSSDSAFGSVVEVGNFLKESVSILYKTLSYIIFLKLVMLQKHFTNQKLKIFQMMSKYDKLDYSQK